MYVFGDAKSGMLLVADPPAGVPLSATLSQAVSAALRSPVPLPLDALLVTSAASWAAMQAALLAGSGTEPMQTKPCKSFLVPAACHSTVVGFA